MSLKDMSESEVMDAMNTGSYGFSGMRVTELEETAYTVATIVIDITGSVYGFASELLEMLKNTVTALKRAPQGP